MLTLLYRADTVGPVCNRLAKAAPSGSIRVVRDNALPVQGARGTIVRWGSRVTIPDSVGQEINSVKAIQLARDKKASRRALGDLAPATWFNIADVNLPCVVRPKRHHAGLHFYVCHRDSELRQAIKRCRLGWYASELIDKAREFRVFVLHERIVCVSERFPAEPKAIAWNLARGGRLINLKRQTWPSDVLRGAIVAAKLLSLDWGAIDIAIDKKGCVYVFEANTAPGLRNPYTIKCVARALLWADKEGRPKPLEGTKWSNLIHPALRGNK